MIFLFGKPPVKKIDAPLEEITAKEVYKLIRSYPKLRTSTKAIRESQEPDEKKELKSTELPYILPFKYSKPIRNSKYFESAEMMIFEVDHLEDVIGTALKIKQDSEVLLQYVSVSGDGLKFVIRLSEPVTSEYYVRLYEILKRRFNRRFNLELDSANKDLARVQYLAYDPNAYLNEKCTVVEVGDILKTLAVFEADYTENKAKVPLEYSDTDIMKAIEYARAHGFLETKDNQLWWELSMSIASLGEAGRKYFLALCSDHPLYPGDTPGKLNDMYTKKFLEKWGEYHDEERKLTMSSFFYKLEKLYGLKAPRAEKTGRKSLEFRSSELFTRRFKGQLFAESSAEIQTNARTQTRWHEWDGKRFKLLVSGGMNKYWKLFTQENRLLALEAFASSNPTDEDKMRKQVRGKKKSNEDEVAEPKVLDDNALSLAEIHTVETQRSMGLGLNWCVGDEALGIPSSKLDSHPYFFNVNNGTIDLRTGKIRPADPADLITKLADVDFNENAKCPHWENFIQRICCDDMELARFLQRAVGYSMTGMTSNHQLYFMFGVGYNGKSTFIETLKFIFGEYHVATGYETFSDMAKSASGHSENVVRLKGARLVVSGETSNGVMNDAVVKNLTGGETVVARALHQSSIEFKPVAKIWIAGNHQPKLESHDVGIRRRVKIIPFNYTFTPDEVRTDTEVREEFMNERAGILNWALAGARMWYKAKDKLETCPAVERASKVFFEESNPVEQFIKEYFTDFRKPTGIGFVDSYDPMTDRAECSKVWDKFQEFKLSLPRDQQGTGKIALYNKLNELGFYRVRDTKHNYFCVQGLKFAHDSETEKTRKGLKVD